MRYVTSRSRAATTYQRRLPMSARACASRAEEVMVRILLPRDDSAIGASWLAGTARA